MSFGIECRVNTGLPSEVERNGSEGGMEEGDSKVLTKSSPEKDACHAGSQCDTHDVHVQSRDAFPASSS